MAMHIKTKWHKPQNKTIEDSASVLAFNIWKIAVQTLDHIGDENFDFADNQARFGVLEEILIFLIQIVDRWSYTHHEDSERQNLIRALTLSLAFNLEENQNEWLGTGTYRKRFLELFNQRAQEYANFTFTEDQPGYQLRRYLGERIFCIMGENNSNRWIMDQIMDIEIPAALKILQRAWQGLISA